MTSLFIPCGRFIGTSGKVLNGKIECDALTEDDLKWFASEIARIVGPFGAVEGVPAAKGGIDNGARIAAACEPYVSEGPLLIVDDVWTTGGSMIRHRGIRSAIGCVLFARYPLHRWCKAVLYSHEAIQGIC